MKRIIGKRVYNTDTAQKLGHWQSGDGGRSDTYSEVLYRTKAGVYFIHGAGGSTSKYAQPAGNNVWQSGEHIEPMSPEAARAWAKERLSSSEYEGVFGAPDDDGRRETLNLSVPASVKNKLILLREKTGKSISQIILELVNTLD